MKLLIVRTRRPKRLLVLPKRALAIPAALLCICALCVLVTLPASVTSSAADRQLPIYSVQRDGKMVSLTFDAAWGTEDTQTLIDILDRCHVKATFFVVGQWADKYPESVKALSDAGHEVMCHSDTHAHFNTLSAREIIDDVNACCGKIEAVTGTRPTLFRPPYGEYDDHVVTTLRAMGMEVIQWDVDSLDWKDYDAGTIAKRVTGRLAPGSIVLFHNAALHTPEALPAILEHLQQEGYEAVPVSKLLLPGEYGTDYTIDHTGRQHPAKER